MWQRAWRNSLFVSRRSPGCRGNPSHSPCPQLQVSRHRARRNPARHVNILNLSTSPIPRNHPCLLSRTLAREGDADAWNMPQHMTAPARGFRVHTRSQRHLLKKDRCFRAAAPPAQVIFPPVSLSYTRWSALPPAARPTKQMSSPGPERSWSALPPSPPFPPAP